MRIFSCIRINRNDSCIFNIYRKLIKKLPLFDLHVERFYVKLVIKKNQTLQKDVNNILDFAQPIQVRKKHNNLKSDKEIMKKKNESTVGN